MKLAAQRPETRPASWAAACGPATRIDLSGAGGLTQSWVRIETLPPGSRSSTRHRHSAEDAMVRMLAGEVVQTATPLRAGGVACWPAGRAVGHRMDSRCDVPARCPVIGTRLDRDAVHDSDHELVTTKDGPRRLYRRRDGTLLHEV